MASSRSVLDRLTEFVLAFSSASSVDAATRASMVVVVPGGGRAGGSATETLAVAAGLSVAPSLTITSMARSPVAGVPDALSNVTALIAAS